MACSLENEIIHTKFLILFTVVPLLHFQFAVHFCHFLLYKINFLLSLIVYPEEGSYL